MNSNLTIVARNNTLFPVDINLLETVSEQDSFINVNRQFLFDMSCEGFSGTNNVRILSKLNGAAAYTTYNVAITSPNLANTVTALNTLGIGTFYSYTSGGISYITVYSTTRLYTSLQLLNLFGLTASANYESFISVNTTGSMKIYFNCALIETFTFPVTRSSPYIHAYGGLVKVVIVGGNSTNPTNYVFYNISSPTASLASGTVAPGVTFTYSFAIDKPTADAFPYTVSISDSV